MIGSVVGKEERLLAVLGKHTVWNSQWSTLELPRERQCSPSVDSTRILPLQ